MVADPTAPAGFEAQFQQFVYYAGPILQILMWVVMIVAVIYALVLFKRLVDFQTGRTKVAHAEEAPALEVAQSKKPAKADAIKVEEFVE